MRQGVLRIQSERAAKTFRGFFQAAVLVIKGSAIDESIEPLRIEAQSAIVSIEPLRPCGSFGFILQPRGKPFVGRGLRLAAYSFLKFASLEVQYELAR